MLDPQNILPLFFRCKIFSQSLCASTVIFPPSLRASTVIFPSFVPASACAPMVTVTKNLHVLSAFFCEN
jgi:hypothetical protein